MKRSFFLSAVAAGNLIITHGPARLLPQGAITQWRWRGREELSMRGSPGRCQGNRRENPWGGYRLEHMLA